MFREPLENGHGMSYYARCEQLVSMLPSMAVAITVLYAMYHLVVHVFTLPISRAADPFD